MPERRPAGSISRALLLNRDYQGTLRLRYQLAEDGCKESQVALAKSLLSKLSTNSEERDFNAELAVHWLLQAAEKGQQEAYDILRRCDRTGIGITHKNRFDVEHCLQLSEKEKSSRRVAFSIFRAIMSDTEENISADIFRERVEQILNQEETVEDLNAEKLLEDDVPVLPEKIDTSICSEDEERVSFCEVVHSIQSCLEGNLPLLTLRQVAQFNGCKKWFSGKYFCLLWNLLLRSTESLIQNLASLSVLCAVFIICIFLHSAAYLSVPGSEMRFFVYQYRLSSVTLLCLLAMLSLTCFVINTSFGSGDVKKWLNLVKFFEPNVEPENAERKYHMKTATPIVMFLIISVVYITLVPLNVSQFAFSDLGALSILFMVLVDRTITEQRYYVNVSLFLNALACFYKGNILKTLSLNLFNSFAFEYIYEFGKHYAIHVNFISCVTLPFVLPFLYTKMALGNARKGWYLVLLPHLMSLTWMNLTCMNLVQSTKMDVFYSLTFLFVILLLSRFLGVIISIAVCIMVKVLYLSHNFSLATTFFILSIFLLIYFISALFVKRTKATYENKICCLIACVAILVLSYEVASPKAVGTENISDEILPWDKYQKHCHHNAWYRTNTAEVQISCLPLKGKRIAAEGTVIAIDVIEVHNIMQSLANMLPNPLHDWFTCTFGKNYNNCEDDNISAVEKEHCLLHYSLNLNKCHLHNWDDYKYRIILEVSTRTSPEIVLLADHICSPFVRHLKEGDSLHAVGVLDSNIGSSSPIFLLQQATCNSCYSDIVCDSSAVVLLPNYELSVRNLVSFYLTPLLQYVPKNTEVTTV